MSFLTAAPTSWILIHSFIDFGSHETLKTVSIDIPGLRCLISRHAIERSRKKVPWNGRGQRLVDIIGISKSQLGGMAVRGGRRQCMWHAVLHMSQESTLISSHFISFHLASLHSAIFGSGYRRGRAVRNCCGGRKGGGTSGWAKREWD